MENIVFMAGLMPLVVFCASMIIKKKKVCFTVPTLIATVGVSVLACVMSQEDAQKQQMGLDKYEYLVDYYLDENEYTKAEIYLTQMYQEYGDIPQVLQGQLRLSVLQGDMETAAMVAKEITTQELEEEMKLTKAEKKLLASAGQSYKTVQEYIVEQAVYAGMEERGIIPEDYGYRKISDQDIEAIMEKEEELCEDIEDAIKERIDKAEKDPAIKTLLKTIKTGEDLSKLLERMEEAGDANDRTEEKLSKYVSELSELYVAAPEAFSLQEIGEHYIIACVLSENYDELLSYANASDDEKALATVAYLNLTEEIRDREIEKVMGKVDGDVVLKQCKAALRNVKRSDLEKEEADAYKEMLEVLDNRNEKGILAHLEERIAKNLDAYGGEAEDYIQSAAINSELLDTEKVHKYLDMAIGAKDSCENQVLSELLGHMSAVTDKKGSNSEITNFNTYLGESYKQSLMVKADSVAVPETFLNAGNVYMNEKRSKMNVGLIQADNFPEVQVYISTADIDLRKLEDLKISDCGIQIEDFKIEKAQYNSAQIMLVCDNSGSMDGDIDVLQEAVRKFIETRNKGEEIGIVTFDSYVVQNVPMTEDTEILMDAVNRFEALGGTNIASGVNAAMQQYTEKENSFRVMIVMTDGQDSSYWNTTLEELRMTCLEKKLIVYTIGLGDVNTDYLESIADSGMGSFVYCNDSTQLEELYAFIHNQVENNYVISYKAVDKNTLDNREFTISSETENYVTSRSYSILAGQTDVEPEKKEDDTETGNVSDENETNPKEENDVQEEKTETSKLPFIVRISKLGVSKIILGENGSKGQEFTIYGTGFDKVSSVSVSLKGKRLYTGLEYSVDSTTKMTVKLPDHVDCDYYDVLISLDGTPYSLKYLTVQKPVKKDEIYFGEYIFKADKITEARGEILLSGNVVMNDYLHFNGDVTLDGSLDGTMLVVHEDKGSYIEGTGKLPGLLVEFYDNKITLPKMDGISIYANDRYEKFYTRGVSFYGPLYVTNPYIEVHPEYVAYSIVDINFDFPVLNNLLEHESVNAPFSAPVMESQFILSKSRLDIILNVESSLNLNKELKLGKAGFKMDSFKMNIDTHSHNYVIEAAVKVKNISFLKDPDASYGLGVTMKSGKLDQIDIMADMDVKVVSVPVMGVPITVVSLSNFHGGVKDMASVQQDQTFWKKVLDTTIYGQTDINCFKLNQVIPGLDLLLGDLLDVSVASFAETTLAFTCQDWNISLDSKAVLFDCIELGQVEVDLGNYYYKNYLLDEEGDAIGLRCKSETAFSFDPGDWFHMGTSGLTQLEIGSESAGALINGGINYNIKTFFRSKKDLMGAAFIGAHNGLSQFTILIKGEENMSGADIGFRLTFSGGSLLPDAELY